MEKKHEKIHHSKKVIKSDGFDMDIYILKPTLAKKPKEDTPGILWIHGGGYVTGMAKIITHRYGIPSAIKGLGRHILDHYGAKKYRPKKYLTPIVL